MRLDGEQCIQLVLADVGTFLEARALEAGLAEFGTVFLDHLGGCAGNRREHDGRVALKGGVERLDFLVVQGHQSFVEKRVLYDFEFDILFEAGTTQCGGVLGVETGDVRKVEIGVFSQLRGYLLDNLSFQFLFHGLCALKLFSGSTDCLGVDANTGAHRRRHEDASDIRALKRLRFQLLDGVEQFNGILSQLLSTE